MNSTADSPIMDYSSNIRLINRFIGNRKYLRKARVKMELVTDDNSPYLFIENPIIISAFAGFVKNRKAKYGIYFRGESGNHKHIVPSLFRDKGRPLTDDLLIQRRHEAYAALRASVQDHYQEKTRFRKEEIDNLLQHYGIKSPVIDMVDNIYVAIWFAMDQNKDGFGYIRIMKTSSKDLGVSDLRKNHSSLSLRLHTQHGLIVKKQVEKWNSTNIFYDSYEVARIKFPITSDIENGILFSEHNFYPSNRLDSTLRILRRKDWLVKEIEVMERRYNLNKGDLGELLER